MIYNILILSLLFSLNAHALWTEKEKNYYKNKYSKKNNNKNDLKKADEIFFVTKETKKLFSKKYGKDALKRLTYFDNAIRSLQGASLYKKLSTIDKLVNRLHFMPDSKHWKKEDYWATPLETIGTNYGDTEDMSLLKFALMVKAGINPSDIQLIKKDIPFKRKNKKYDENVSLFYFTKKSINPLVIDYDYRKGEIYKYADQFKFEFIKSSPSKHWSVIFKKDLKSTDLDKLANLLQEKKSGSVKDDVHIFY